MKSITLAIAITILAISGCGYKTTAQREEAHRAEREIQSVRQMIRSRELPKIEFESNSAVLLPESYRTLDKIADVLLHYPSMKLIVEGHTDDVGSDDYNDELSLARAGAVKEYLVQLGVYPDFIRVKGYGKRRPVVYGTSNEARSLNRRVEFVLTTRSWQAIF